MTYPMINSLVAMGPQGANPQQASLWPRADDRIGFGGTQASLITATPGAPAKGALIQIKARSPRRPGAMMIGHRPERAGMPLTRKDKP